MDEEIRVSCLEAIKHLENLGAEVEWVDLPDLVFGIPAYYIIMPAESSTNLARFDGIKYGLQDDTMKYDSIGDYYAEVRNRGFGAEVKRRILMGTYVLSAGHYDAYYYKAQQVRQKIKSVLDDVYSKFDAIVSPTTPTLPWKVGENNNDPVTEYL